MSKILDGVVSFYPKSSKGTILIKMLASAAVAIYALTQKFSIQQIFVAFFYGVNCLHSSNINILV